MKERVVAAIDVGTNAVRLRIARVTPRGLQTVVHQRDPIRPGEGVFSTGLIPRHVADRLIATLRRYKTECDRAGARVRAVATSAVREAKNQGEIVRRVRAQAGVLLEVISGMEEARLTCLGVLEGTPPDRRSLCVDIGGGSTEIALATGERPAQLYSMAIGAVRITDLFESSKKVNDKKLALMRQFAGEALEEGVPGRLPGAPSRAIGSSGTISAVVKFAVSGSGRLEDNGPRDATATQISRAVEELAAMTPRQRRDAFDDRRADIIAGGAVVLEAVMKRLDLDAITAVDRGLRDGILVDLVRREGTVSDDDSLSDAAISMGRRFLFDERHGRQVARIALALFDGLATLHKLPAAARPYLQVAALLHDVGHAVSYQKHHRHTYYLIQNGDLPGLADRERELVARIARFHRRSPPDPSHAFMADLSADERTLVRRCAVLLRVADSLDRSHHQPVQDVRASTSAEGVTVTIQAKGAVDLEVWDSAHELDLFRHTFGRSLHVRVRR